MTDRVSTFALILATLVAASGCIGTTQAGLSNVGAPVWRRSDPANTHDVVANGPDACASPQMRVSDPPTVGSIQCYDNSFENVRRAWEPPDQIHRNY